MTNELTAGNSITTRMPLTTSATLSNEALKEERLAQILDSYLVSLENGAPLDLEELVSQHQELADEIRSMATSLDLLHHTTRQMRPAAEQPPQAGVAKRLGDFSIGRELGRGGMGVVYAARQISLQRDVALKVLPFAAMWDQKQVARFRNEALAAAQLHHPNIVPVFAVGEERGVHFYAMQLVDGQSLDQLVRSLQKRDDAGGQKTPEDAQAMASTATWHTTEAGQPAPDLSTQHSTDRSGYCRAIARLGKQTAAALHHAHEYGIVHRDIKPSNLMVDGRGKLWVTDFGLARSQTSPSVTITGDIVGTLRYMSPEQAAGDQALVDTRTDIYALGATLYELLTLRPAFPGDDRHAVLRAIASEEPLAPRLLNPAIPIDLETILLQAMSKSRDQRYATAAEFADDLQRFLDGKPTRARRPTILDRVTKWTQRHRSLVAVASLFLVTLAIGSSLAAIKISREQTKTANALAAAEQNLEQANENFAQARRIVDRFGVQLADQLQDTPGTERLRQHLLLETLNYYHEFADQIDGQLEVQDQLAMTHLKAGVVTAKLGARRKALSEYHAAQQLLIQLLAEDAENTHLKSQLALSRNNTALLFAESGDVDTARSEYEAAIRSQQELVATEPNNLQWTRQLAESYLNLGTLEGESNRIDRAIDSLNRAIEILKSASKATPSNLQLQRSLAMAYNNLGFLQRSTNAIEAELSASNAVELLERVCKVGGAHDGLADFALCYANLAAIQTSAGKSVEAVRSFRRAIQLRESLVRRSPSIVQYRSELAANLNNLALLQIRIGEVEAADQAFARANRLFAELVEDYPQQLAYASGWAALLNNQGLALARSDRHEQAIKAYQQALIAQERVWKQLPNAEEVRETLSRIYYNYAEVLQSAERFAEAAEQAIARRVLWQNNGERLFGVAVELARIAESAAPTSEEYFNDAIVSTLSVAFQAGHEPQRPIESDPRFERWHTSPDFLALLKHNDELATLTAPEKALP